MAMTPRTGRTVPSRPRPAAAAVRPVYEEFRPMTEWKQDEESNYLLLIYLPGFQREHLKVSTEGRNILRARGERLVAGNKWSRFQDDYPIPEDCNVRGIRAKFEGGILTVTIPRKEEAEAAFTKEAHKPTEETHKPSQSPPKAAMKKTYQEAADEKTRETPPPDQKMSTEKQKNSPNEKPVEKSKEETDHQNNTQQKGKLAEVAGHAFYTLEPPIPRAKMRVAPDLVLLGYSGKAKGQYEEKIDQKFAQRINEVREHITEGTTEKPKSEENKGKAEAKEKKTIAASAASSSTDFGLANYKHAVKNFMDMKEERQLLVNVGAAVLVIVAFGAYLSYTFK